MTIDYKSIGIRIRRFRKEMGLTQQQLAELSDLEPSNLSHIERGATKLSLPTIIKIANALGVTVDELLCDNLYKSSDSFMKIASDILSDCSHEEMLFLTESMLSLKQNLRNFNQI